MHMETPRLVLLRANEDILRADLEGSAALAGALGIAVSSEWPPSGEYDADAINYMIALLDREPAAYDWGFRYIVRKASELTVIGAGGYTGPAKDGAIEIGYSICPSERRRGFATETTQVLTDNAFRNSDVARVIAHTLPELISSIGVLKNCGFKHVGSGAEGGTVRYAIERADWRG
ncbi:putative acetyltransferase [Terricaulis silvestris]|uniref:Putative acetyltransferase n=2 Tax=Terricaulis silvestris TaxID=2686094 RepID=A0A6I6MHD9_9CAUL|nr:putative acetyltransferase [Terricaulis silvestris]